MRTSKKSTKTQEEETKENDEEENMSETNAHTKNKNFRIVSNSPNKNFDTEVKALEPEQNSLNEEFDYQKQRGKLISDAFQDGEFVYDLYSILVHSGGAYGGHYFAYIKSFENGKWYLFNDSNVLEVDPNAIPAKTFGGSLTTSSYMLFYRKVNKDAFFSESEFCKDEILIPGYLRQKIETERVFLKEQAEIDRLNKKITVRVYHKLEVKHIMISAYQTYTDLLLETLKEFNMMEFLGNVRLRSYAPHTDFMLDDYDGKEDQILVNLEISSFKTLCIETKLPSENFVPYIKDSIYFRYVQWKTAYINEGDENNDIEKIQINKDAKTVDLLLKISQTLGLQYEECKFFKKIESNTLAVIDLSAYTEFPVDQSLPHQGIIVYVEINSDETSKWKTFFEGNYYLFTIKYNDPRIEGGEANEEIIFDARRTLFELKSEICSKLELSMNKVIMRRGGRSGIDIKDISPSLLDLGFFNKSSIFLELGTPCGPGEFRIYFYKSIPVFNDPYKLNEYEYLFELPIHGMLKPSDVILKAQEEALVCKIPLEGNWRLREKLSDRMGRIYKDSAVKTQGIFDKRAMVLEPVISEEKDRRFSDRDLLIIVRKWDQVEWKLLPWFEIFVDKFQKLHHIAETIFNVEKSIPIEFMSVCLILSLKSFSFYHLDKEEVDAFNSVERTQQFR